MAEERINDIIEDRAFQQVEKMTADLNLMYQALEKVLLTNTELVKVTGQSTESLAKKSAKTKDVTAATIETQLQQKKLKDTLTDQQKAVSSAVDAYGKLQLAYKTAQRESLNLGTSLGVQSKEYKEATAKAANLKAEIDRLNKATGDHRTNVGNYQSALKGLGGQLLAITGLAGGLAMVTAFFKDSFLAYEGQKKQERGLANAMQGREESVKSLIEQAKKLQLITGVDDEQIISVQKLAATHNLTAEQIKKVTKASLDFAAVTGQDVNQAAVQLLGTMEGSLRGLGRWASEFKDLTADQLRNGAAIDFAAKKYAGFAEAAATSTSKLNVLWHETKENFGKIISPLVENTLKMLNGMFTMVGDIGKEQVSQQFAEKSLLDLMVQRVGLEKQIQKYKDNKEATEARKENLKLLDDEITRRQKLRKEEETASKIQKEMFAEEKARAEEGKEKKKEEYGSYEKLTKSLADYQEKLNNAIVSQSSEIPVLRAKVAELKSIKDAYDIIATSPAFLKPKEFTGQIKFTANTQIPTLKPEQVFPLPTDKMSEEWGKFYKDLQNLAIDTLGTGISDQITASFENSIGQMREQLDSWHEKQLKDLEERKEKGLITDKEYQDGKDKIEKEYEIKRKAQRVKEAQIKKQEALWEIAINTAVAASQTLGITDPRFWLVIANGAAQAALVAARPLPTYAKGRKGGKGEWAITGDAGQEAIRTREGKTYLTPDSPTVTYLPSGADVLSNMELKQAIFNKDITNFDDLKYTLSNDIRRLIDTVTNKREVSINIDNNGLKTFVRNGNAYQEYLNRNVRL